MNSFTDISFGCLSVPVRSLECPLDIHFNSIENRLLMTKMTEGSEGTDSGKTPELVFSVRLVRCWSKGKLMKKGFIQPPVR